MTNLEDLVPPLDLCYKHRIGDFAKSVFVWNVRCSPNKIQLIPRSMWDHGGYICAAPTLAEIHAAMGAKVRMSICRRSEDGKWYIMIFWTLEDGRETMTMGEMDENPATAALKCYYGKRNAKVV